ncbi:hypothetical protein ABZ721_40270 [Streptomyces sp. NPDC006733]|uniref:hypothetical protein n=1 Tax=Streptomyces sp. NPDC006733 TaxID=3155460 RepID=UPI00340E5196
MTANRGRWPKIDQDSGVEDAVLLILEWLSEQGMGAMIRVDAERLQDQKPAWTFTAGGGPLIRPMRADGATAHECLSLALVYLREAGVDVPY